MLTIRRALALSILAAAPAAAQAPNPTNLWLVELRWTNGRLSTGAPVKLTHDDGPNSQPSFSPDGSAVIFSATRDTGANARSEIYRIDLATRAESRITRTAENENSPTVNEQGEYVAVRWNPATLFKEFGPWVYSANGEPARGVLRAPDTTGYYTPLPNGNYALTRPKSKTFTLGLFDAASGAIVDVDSGLPALPAVRIPGENALSYVQIDSMDAKNVIRRIDLATRVTTTIGRTVTGRTAHAWVAGHRTLLMAKGNQLYARTPEESTWRVVATFTDPELRNASAYVVSAQGDKLILTSPKRLAFATVLRDSLEAGRSGREVAEFATQAIRTGTLRDVDIAEGPISALGDDRVQKRRFADGIAIHTLATALFPSSYRAMGRLGDAQMAARDSTGALATYKRALDLNPRATDAEKQAAEAIERKISGRPPAAQNPSPMVENSRAHERLAAKPLPGSVRSFKALGDKTVDLFTPEGLGSRYEFDLVIHFHGAAWLAHQAVAALDTKTAAAALNLGAGSGVYHRAFAEPGALDSLLAAIAREVTAATGQPARISRVTLTGWSAGHGAIRAILLDPKQFARVHAIMLIDGMHTSYVPEGMVVEKGGLLDTTNLVAFRNFAQAAMRGEKRFLVTHSEIFPGTFASTTETADWLVRSLGVKRTPVLKWGPRGVQQLSEVRQGRFEIQGFAGNTAPDHVDQLHAIPELLAHLLK